MKMITAVIKPSRLDAVLEAVTEAAAVVFTVQAPVPAVERPPSTITPDPPELEDAGWPEQTPTKCGRACDADPR